MQRGFTGCLKKIPEINNYNMVFYSTFESSYLWLPLIGFVIGLLATMIGGGGGFFFPPALMLFFQVPAHVAVSTSLAATLPICFIGALGHYRHGNLHLNTGLIFAIAGIMGAIAGASVTGLLDPEQLRSGFGIYSILLALLIMYNNRKKEREAKAEKSSSFFLRLFNKVPAGSFYGFVGGMISGTFGTSGTAPVLAGLFAVKLPIKLVAGTSLMILFINTLSALTGHLFLGNINMTLVLFLTSGSLLGAIFGPLLTRRINFAKKEGALRDSFAYVILAFGILMILT